MRHTLTVLCVVLMLNSCGEVVFARGFGGGFRGGGFSGGLGGGRSFGGGFSGRSFEGSLGGERFNSGGLEDRLGGGRANFGDGGGFNRGLGEWGERSAGGSFSDRSFGSNGETRFASPNRGQLNSFLGLPSDEGFNVHRGAVTGPLGGEAAGISATGPRGNTVGRAAAIGPEGRVGGVSGIRGADGEVAGRGFVAGPNGAVAGFARATPSERYACGAAVRTGYNHWGFYNSAWYTAHPGAWVATGWAAGAAWRACTWGDIAAFCGYDSVAPYYYDYGNNLTYQDNNVYVNNQLAYSGAQYYEQAATVASTGVQSPASPDADWLPLGVFALTKIGQNKSDVDVQLAVNHSGVIRGNYTDTVTNKTQLIQGSVDRTTQRVALIVGENQTNVIETGLYNLTKDEVPVLIHFGKDRTESWLLVRLVKPDQSSN